MKLITAIKLIEEREKNKRKAEKENKKNVSNLKHNSGNYNNQLKGDPDNGKHLVHVQSIFPQDDIIALKLKTKEGHIREAISKAVYYYLKCGSDNRT